MARGRRRISPFNLSFLDIMACGLGAVTLLFLILKHDVDAVPADPELRAEADLLQEEVRTGEKELVELRNSLSQMEKDIVEAQGRATQVLTRIEETRRELSAQPDPEEEIESLRAQIAELEEQKKELEEETIGRDVRRFVGDGDRQYLTGLKLGGKRVLILLDISASMLAEDIINTIRRRNMGEAARRQSAKWQRVLRTTEWLLAQLPPESSYQVYSFNTSARPVLADSDGTWLQATDTATMDSLVESMRTLAPSDGNSLINGFYAIQSFDRPPDNIFLLTDSLPTQGESRPRKNTVTGREREQLFEQAVKALPRGTPVNTILFPFEGDPMAAARFWGLAINSRGSFLSPSRDWP